MRKPSIQFQCKVFKKILIKISNKNRIYSKYYIIIFVIHRVKFSALFNTQVGNLLYIMSHPQSSTIYFFFFTLINLHNTHVISLVQVCNPTE